MIKLYIPQLDDLWFRQMFMADEETMSYNHHWGGIIPFPEERWPEWYDYWVANPVGKRFYRYLKDEVSGEFVGEIAYHYDEERKIHMADVIVYAKCRGRGIGEQGLLMLCEAAKANDVEILYDDIAIDNPAIKLFLKLGFHEECRTDEIIMLKKELQIWEMTSMCRKGKEKILAFYKREVEKRTKDIQQNNRKGLSSARNDNTRNQCRYRISSSTGKERQCDNITLEKNE